MKASGVFWTSVCMFHRSDFFGANVLSNCPKQRVIFLGEFAGVLPKSGKYVAGTFLSKCQNRTLLRSSVCFSREIRVDWVLGLSSLRVSGCCVGLCMADFPDGPIKKGPACRSFVERKKGLQAPSDTWSFRLVLVPGSREFLDPAGFSLPEFGVYDWNDSYTIHDS